MIECAFVENLSVLRGPSQTPFESFPTPWDPFADSSFCSLNRSFSALGGNLFSLPDLWRIPLELSPTPSWPFVVLRGPSWISFLAFVDNPQLFQASSAAGLAALAEPASPSTFKFRTLGPFGTALASIPAAESPTFPAGRTAAASPAHLIHCLPELG